MGAESITNECNALDGKISKLLANLATFVRHVREARSDLDAVSSELHSLQNVLGLLREDAALFPPELAEQAPTIIEHCSYVVDQLDEYVSTLCKLGLSKLEKRTQWLGTGRLETAGFRATLEAHKATIGLALDLVEATAIRDSIFDTEPGGKPGNEVVGDISRILLQMDQICAQLPEEFDESPSYFSLHEYMGDLKRYAEAFISQRTTPDEAERLPRQVERETEPGPYLGDQQMFGAYIGDGPDWAIDVDVEPRGYKDDEISPLDEIPDQSVYLPSIPSRAPTPPPKDAKRFSMARQMDIPSLEHRPDPLTNSYEFVTEIWANDRKPASSMKPKGRGIGRFFSPFKTSISEIKALTHLTHSSTTGPASIRPISIKTQGSGEKSRLGRLSISFRRRGSEPLTSMDGLVSKAVFGVSLQKSMQVAKGASKTHHGNQETSRRDFPLCMQKCCFFLKNEGLTSPDIFAEPGDIFRVSKLKEIFSTGPTYGADVNFANYTVYDAADLIMLYLSQLPQPLIPESLAKRWIPLAKQASLTKSHAKRLDQCIGFWEEALSGLRGPSRSLFKLLLNLWAEIATAEDTNEMTAERLAGVVLKPLLHISPGQHKTDYTRPLAFLIRKRAEYMELLAKNQSAVNRISRSAW